MDVYLLDWANLLLRWLHVIAAIAWIGTSMYFVLLDDGLEPPVDPELRRRGVGGESWAVHGGGFYHANKYLVAPPNLPDKLHWSYLESYTTWVSGFALLIALYFTNASTFLVDRRVFDWSPTFATIGALVYLGAGWFVYDAICRLFGRDPDGSVGGNRRVGILVFLYVCATSWIACHLFAGRAAFVLTGAMLATVMTGNVAAVIIPGQRKIVAAMRAGLPVDPDLGRRGKQRSVHNTYFTLPVVIAMLSNHYGMLTQHPLNWLALILLMAAGAVIRLFFVLQHKAPPRWEFAAIAIMLIIGVAALVAPRSDAGGATTTAASFDDVQAVIAQRCAVCHNAQVANKNVRLHTPALIRSQAQLIYQQAVVLKLMPMNNATQITDAERALLARWYAAGAP